MQNFNLNRPDAWKRLLQRRRKSVKMITFSADVAEWQNTRHTLFNPKHFLAENPWSSRAWKTRPGRRIQRLPRTQCVKVDQCTLGLRDPLTGARLKKRMRISTDSPMVAEILQDKRWCLVCNRMTPMPEHKAIEGSTVVTLPNGTKQRKNLNEVAGGWPKPLCQLLLKGFKED